MEPFATAISRTHLVLIAIATACLVYALSPHDARHFYAGQIEAQALASFDTSIGDPRRSREQNLDSAITDSQKRIAEAAGDFGFKVRWLQGYRGALSRPLPTANSPLSEWKKFINDPHVRVYVKAPDGESIRRAFEQAKGGPDRGLPHCVALPSHQLKECKPPIPGATLIGAWAEPLRSEDGWYALGADKGEPQKWLFVLDFVENSSLAALAFRSYALPIEKLNLNYFLEYFPGNSIDLAFAALPRLEHAAQPPMIRGLQKLFRQTRDQEVTGGNLPLRDDLRFEHWFPTLINSWEDVSKMNPLDATNFFRTKQMAARQSLSIAGQTLDERILAFAGPIALLVVSTYLLFNLIAMRAGFLVYVPADVNALQFPWFGLATTGIPFWFTQASILYLPALAGLALWIQSDREINAGIDVGAAATLTTVFVGWRASRELRLLRADLTAAISIAVLKVRGARRTEILDRRKARKAKRTSTVTDSSDRLKSERKLIPSRLRDLAFFILILGFFYSKSVLRRSSVRKDR